MWCLSFGGWSKSPLIFILLFGVVVGDCIIPVLVDVMVSFG